MSDSDPIADIKAAYRRIEAMSGRPGGVCYIQMRPEVYNGLLVGLRRGARHARKALRRRLPAKHRPTYARLAARRARAAEYLAGLPHPEKQEP